MRSSSESSSASAQTSDPCAERGPQLASGRRKRDEPRHRETRRRQCLDRGDYSGDWMVAQSAAKEVPEFIAGIDAPGLRCRRWPHRMAR